MKNKLKYIPNDEKLSYPLNKLKLLVEKFTLKNLLKFN